MTPPRTRRCVFLFLFVAALVFAASGTSARAEPGDLAPTWQAEISAAESNLAGERQKLEEARVELQEAEADGDSSYAESRRERVTYYEERVGAAQAQVVAAKAGLAKQTELDKAGEPQDRLREVKESINYYETLRDEAQAVGADATVGVAIDELEGGTFGGGLYEMLEEEQAKRKAKEAVTPGEETTGPETTGEATNETTEAAPAPGDGDGGAGNEAAPEEPTPDEPEEAGNETPAGYGPGIGGLLGDINLVPIAAFAVLAGAAVFALAKSGGMDVKEYFSIRQFLGPVMGQRKKTKPKKPKKTKTKAATKTPEPVPETPKIEASEDESEQREKPLPEPGEDARKPGGTTAEELNELFNQDGEDEEEGDDENPPD